MNKPYFCRNCLLIDWRHKYLKNTIDLMLFYEEHFYGFSESDVAMDFLRSFSYMLLLLVLQFHAET